MSKLQLSYLGDAVLRRRAEPVEVIDDSLRKLAADMIETMYTQEGVGLAAPQVGVSKRMFVYDNVTVPYGTDPKVLINPEIVEMEGKVRGEEGCLSIPEIKDLVDRAEKVTVAGQDLDGNELEIQADGMAARIFQHEIDHLDGVLFVDRVGEIKRNLLLAKWNKIREELVPERDEA